MLGQHSISEIHTSLAPLVVRQGLTIQLGLAFSFLCSLGMPQIVDPPASSYQQLGLQVCTTTPDQATPLKAPPPASSGHAAGYKTLNFLKTL